MPATALKQNKKRKSSKIRWRIFGAILVPTIILIVILWVLQTVFLGAFYGGIKTSELKKTTHNVINNLESEDIKDRILILSNDGDINIRVIETQQFKTLYSTGDVFNSVTYGWQSFGMFNLYEQVSENGGELIRYYSENDEIKDENTPKRKDAKEQPFIDVPAEFPDNMPKNKDEMHHFRERFRPVAGPDFFNNVGRHNDLLYAMITTLSDGTEVMVVADTRISPLDSTVTALRHQLVFCSVITVILSLIVSFVIAKHISKPIEKINKSAKLLAGGQRRFSFHLFDIVPRSLDSVVMIAGGCILLYILLVFPVVSGLILLQWLHKFPQSTRFSRGRRCNSQCIQHRLFYMSCTVRVCNGNLSK